MSHEIGQEDPRNLLLRSVRHLAGSSIPIESNAPSSVHLGFTESLLKPGQYMLSLVNTTSGPIRPVRELLPVYDISIKLRLNGKSFGSHKVLRCQGECRVKSTGQNLEIEIGKLQDYFAIHIQMNS